MGNYPCYCKQLGSQTDVQIVPAVAPVWVSGRYFCAWRGRNVLLWYGCRVGKCVLAPCRVYTQGLMTPRNVDQRFNKQNQRQTWCAQMCIKWLLCPLGSSILQRMMGGKYGAEWWMGLEEDVTWTVITNTSRAWLSLSLALAFSVFWKLGQAPALVSEARGLFSGRGYSSSVIVFVCAAGGKERTALASKSSALQGLHKASTLLLFLLLLLLLLGLPQMFIYQHGSSCP